MDIKEKIEEIVKQACIEAQNNKFITPIVFRQSIKLLELVEEEKKKVIKEMKDIGYGCSNDKCPYCEES